MKKLTLTKIVFNVMVLVLLYFQDTLLATSYTITEVDFGITSDLKVLTGVNNTGQVVGWCRGSDTIYRSFLWENGNATEIASSASEPSRPGINNLGEVVGSKNGSIDGVWYSYAFKWTKEGGVTYITPADIYSGASGINDRGEIIGQARGIESWFWTETLWKDGQLIPCPGWPGFGEINNAGVIAGSCTLYMLGPTVARTYSSPVWNGEYWEWDIHDLSPAQSFAYGINDSGQVVGSYNGRAMLWSGGETIDLGSGGAAAINNSGQVVGNSSYPFLWENGSMYNLNDLVVNGENWVLQSAVDISNAGYIIGSGQLDGQSSLFLLSPIPEPATLLLLGLGGLAVVRKQRLVN